MDDLKRFRDQVTKHRKPYTQTELERAIGLPTGELSHRLGGTGRQPLTRQNILDIVVKLAEWQGVTWKEAVELLDIMDYPLDTFEWKRRLQEHLTPPDLSFPAKGSLGGVASALPERMLLQPRRRLFLPPNQLEGYVPRAEIFQKIKRRMLERGDSQTIGITTALRGAGGFGKTTLARALCHDAEIQEAFPDILWIELGERPPQALDLLNRLLTLYEDSPTEALTLQEAQERWHLALQDRACLLVIDDVWQQEVLSPLLLGGARCRHLVTTRNDLLLPKRAVRVVVDAMTQQEAVQVLCQDEELPEEIFEPSHQLELKALAERLGCWPLLLTLARGMLIDLVVKCHQSIAEALATIAEAHQTRGVTAFRLDNVEERQRTIDACLKVSLEHLETFTHPHYRATERYQELAVFPEDTDIPLATLQVYWKVSAGLKPWETKDLCTRLHRLSLLLTCDMGAGTIRLHDVVRSYLIQRAGSNLPELHVRLLEACQQKYGITRWADLPRSEVYLWQHLIFHFCQAGRQEALQATLIDLSYLIRKALYVGVSALEYDLILTDTTPSPKIAEPVPSFLVSLHRSIMRISHLIRQAQTEAEMGGLLLSHLGWEPAFTALRISLKCELPPPFLIAQHPLPNKSSFALQRTLQGHTDRVNDCAVSPDGKWIVSASDDETLKVWDATTGVQRLTLSGHTAPVYACAVSPDGSFVVSASADQTLKIWDAATGSERLTLEGHTGAVNGCAVSPDGSFIVSASQDKTLKIWDAAMVGERFSSGHTAPVYACAVSPDGRFIVSASQDKTLKIWDAATGSERLTLEGHTEAVNGCAFSPDGSFIVSASDDQTLKIWDAATGSERLTLEGHTWYVQSCAVSLGGNFIVSASWDGTLKVWDAATGSERLTLEGHTWLVNCCVVSPDGKFIVSASWDGTLKVWDAATGEERLTLRGHSDVVNGCALSVDGCLVVSASRDQTLKVWETHSGRCLLTFPVDGALYGCAFHPDGEHLVAYGDQGVYFLRLVM